MNIIIHYPTSEAGQSELAKRVARIHAEAMLQRLEHLPYSKDEKAVLMEAILSRQFPSPCPYRDE